MPYLEGGCPVLLQPRAPSRPRTTRMGQTAVAVILAEPGNELLFGRKLVPQDGRQPSSHLLISLALPEITLHMFKSRNGGCLLDHSLDHCAVVATNPRSLLPAAEVAVEMPLFGRHFGVLLRSSVSHHQLLEEPPILAVDLVVQPRFDFLLAVLQPFEVLLLQELCVGPFVSRTGGGV